LQIIEEQGEWVFRPSEHAEKLPENRSETALRIYGRKIRHRRLLTDNQFKFGNDVNNHLTVGIKGISQGVTPLVHLGVSFGQDLMDECLKGFGQSGIRDIAFVLIELTGGE
jgi:hypothetical protein